MVHEYRITVKTHFHKNTQNDIFPFVLTAGTAFGSVAAI